MKKRYRRLATSDRPFLLRDAKGRDEAALTYRAMVELHSLGRVPRERFKCSHVNAPLRDHAPSFVHPGTGWLVSQHLCPDCHAVVFRPHVHPQLHVVGDERR